MKANIIGDVYNLTGSKKSNEGTYRFLNCLKVFGNVIILLGQKHDERWLEAKIKKLYEKGHYNQTL